MNELLNRLRALTKTARMWGSPEELETVAMHFTHVLLKHATLEQTWAFWQAQGGPFAGDAEEHAAMREKMYGADEALARVQVVQGFVVVWASLERNTEREAQAGGWIEQLLDHPDLISTPDRLNMTLFALMGFVAADAQKYVNALNLERHRIGGHELRPFAVVAPSGATDAGVTYTRNFTSWPRVIDGITRIAESLSPSPGGPGGRGLG